MDENDIARSIVRAALYVHSSVGPGLFENVYQACLVHELEEQGLPVEAQVVMPLRYKGLFLDVAYRLDLIVGRKVVIEMKSVEQLMPLHRAQLLTYLRLSGHKLGLLLNFNTLRMRDGIKRVVNGL